MRTEIFMYDNTACSSVEDRTDGKLRIRHGMLIQALVHVNGGHFLVRDPLAWLKGRTSLFINCLTRV
jgi:hypothetical protein